MIRKGTRVRHTYWEHPVGKLLMRVLRRVNGKCQCEVIYNSPITLTLGTAYGREFHAKKMVFHSNTLVGSVYTFDVGYLRQVWTI